MYVFLAPQPNNWPSKGEVCFENVTLRYGPEDPPVLRNLNFVIRSGWKVKIGKIYNLFKTIQITQS